MRTTAWRWAAPAAVALLALFSSAPKSSAAPGLTGAIYTTEWDELANDCTTVNMNIYPSKTAVGLNGGPNGNGGGSGLPDGDYYVQVTEPDGTLLGTSVGSGNETPVHCSGGSFAECYQLWAIVVKASDQTEGYDTTTNAGGEYKVWVSKVNDFAESQTKTDNFKVDSTRSLDTGNLCVRKFYDANANGVWDDGDVEIEGWLINLEFEDGFTDTVYTAWCSTVEAGDWTVTEGTPIESYWLHTTPLQQNVTVDPDGETEVVFGNLCLGAGGGLTLGFWSNKNGQGLITSSDLTYLSGLSLRDGSGADFDPSGKAELKSWLLKATAVNMAYMLSAQLTAMELNVRHGKVDADALIYAPCCGNYGVDLDNDGNGDFITIADLMGLAEAELAANGYTPSGDENRSYQECLKNALDDANNNKNFVQSGPCPFTFE
jgi:hypothetical protein